MVKRVVSLSVEDGRSGVVKGVRRVVVVSSMSRWKGTDRILGGGVCRKGMSRKGGGGA